jgi:hypothetical protein
MVQNAIFRAHTRTFSSSIAVLAPITVRISGLRPLAGQLARVSPGKEKLEEVTEELQRDVLERISGAMEELEDELVVAELGQGCDVGMPERGSVRSGHDRAQLVTRELVRGDVEREMATERSTKE